MNSADSGERHPGMTTRSVARIVLTLYGVSLAMIALWPVPVDQGAAGFLRRVGRVLPMLTYPRIEFSANILLFVPLGVLLMLILRRRYLILPIAIVVTVAIECSQGLLLDKRTPSVLDIIANTAGACLGMLIVAAVESWRSRDRPARMRAATRGDDDADGVGCAGHPAAGCGAATGAFAARAARAGAVGIADGPAAVVDSADAAASRAAGSGGGAVAGLAGVESRADELVQLLDEAAA
jgi:VanZ family protein